MFAPAKTWVLLRMYLWPWVSWRSAPNVPAVQRGFTIGLLPVLPNLIGGACCAL